MATVTLKVPGKATTDNYLLQDYKDDLNAINTELGNLAPTASPTLTGTVTTANGTRIKGDNTGVTNTSWVGFYESNGTTRTGFVGDGSSTDDDIWLGADRGNIVLYPAPNKDVFCTFGSTRYRVWHENNDGSGSTLDADKLDGYHLSDIAITPSGVSNDISQTNLNAATRSGFYRGWGMTNAPDSGWWYVVVESHDNNANAAAGWTKQTVTAYGSGNTAQNVPGTMYVRLRQGSTTWTSWQRIWTDNNNYMYGMVAYFAWNGVPSGWLKCDGSAIGRTAYPYLWGLFGTTFGAGDGSTTFNLPDLRGEFIRGWDNGRGADSGRAFGSWQGSQNLDHYHAIKNTTRANGLVAAPSGSSGTDGIDWCFYDYGVDATAAATRFFAAENQYGGSNVGGTEARPRNVALLACIKY